MGGAVRDLVLRVDSPPVEIDIASSALPEEVQAIFPHTEFVGKAFGVCLVRTALESGDVSHQFEVATFRKEGGYSDGRHPDYVEKGTLEEDSCRRDFTMNALYFDPVEEAIYDFHDGISHAMSGCIFAVGNAEKRFQEDALRIVRLFRFAANCFMEIDSATLSAAVAAADGLRRLSRERILQESLKVNSGCFGDFANALFGAVSPPKFDGNLPSTFCSRQQFGMWQESFHKRFPMTAIAFVLSEGTSSEPPLQRFHACVRAFETWPCTRLDERLMRICLNLFDEMKDSDVAHSEFRLFRMYQRLKDFQGVSVSDALFTIRVVLGLSGVGNVLWKDVLLRLSFMNDSVDSIETWLRAQIESDVTPDVRRAIASSVQENGGKPHMIGAWVDIREAVAFFSKIGIVFSDRLTGDFDFAAAVSFLNSIGISSEQNHSRKKLSSK